MDNNILKNNQIKVFVSSTFSDLIIERTYLVDYVFPSIHHFCEARGYDFVEVDLRWGVTAHESENGDVLKVCLNEISNSFPFFIGIIGSRYGWIPDKEKISNYKSLIEMYPQVSDYLDHKYSITEMEMMFGVLDSDHKMKAAFFVRKISGEDLSEEGIRLQALRDRIKSQHKYPYFEYNSIEEFGNAVDAYISREIKDICNNTDIESEDSYAEQQQQYARKCLINYIPDQNQINELDCFLNSDNRTYYVFKGDYGSGKSSLVAYYQNRVNSSSDSWKVICHFNEAKNDADVATNTESDTMIYLQTQIANSFHFNNLNLDEQLDKIGENSDYKLLLILDNITLNSDHDIDDINSLEYGLQKILFKKRDSKNIKFIFTTYRTLRQVDYSSHTTYILTQDDYAEKNFFDPNEKQKKKIVEQYFNYYSKKLPDPSLLDLIVKSNIESPFKLKLILNDLRLFGDYNSFPSYLNRLLECSSSGNLVAYYIDVMKQKYGSFVKDFFCYICVDNYFTETELISILGIRRLDWSRFFHACSLWFTIDKGYIRPVYSDFNMYDQNLARDYYRTRIVEFFIFNYGRFPYSLKKHFKHKGSHVLNAFCRDYEWKRMEGTLLDNELIIYEYLLEASPSYKESYDRKFNFYIRIQLISEIFDRLNKETTLDWKRYYNAIYLWLENFYFSVDIKERCDLYCSEDEKLLIEKDSSKENLHSYELNSADENRSGFVDEDDDGEFDFLLDRFIAENAVLENRIVQFKFYNITAKLAKLLKEYALNKSDLEYELSVAKFFNSNGC